MTVVEDTLAFLSVYDGRIEVVDISNPNLPAVIGEKNFSSSGVRGPMTVRGNYAFVPASRQNAGVNQAGVAVLQITPLPEALRLLSITYVPIGEFAGRLAVEGMTVYAPVSGGNLYVIDASNPSAPKVVGDANTGTMGVVVSGNSLCTTTDNGLTILPAQCPSSTAVPDPPISLHPTLGAAFPNPTLSGSTTIPFTLSQPGHVNLRIIDLEGLEVRTILDGVMVSGEKRAQWDGRNARGKPVPAGIYFYELLAPGIQATRKMVRLR